MAKKVVAQIKLQIPAGKATPAPPVGPALGQHGVNIMEFCKQYNARTAQDEGLVIPVIITVFHDKSFSFVTRTPPAAVLLKRAANLAKGSGVAGRESVAQLPKSKIVEIAKIKLPDLNCKTLEAAIATVEGTARSMGIKVEA